MSRIVISLETNPYVNIACEYQLFLEHTEGVDLYLWQNDPCVVIGRNQNMYAECDLEYLKDNNIYPTRRFSGGGAVYQDLGNVNFTFIANSKKVSEKDLLLLAQKAVKQCGIDSEFSGRNDLMYNQKKFSGLAYFYQNNKIMFHGTMLVDVDLDKLTSVLNPSQLKLKSKGIESVRNRVINLASVDSTLTQQAIKDAFVDVFQKEYMLNTNILYSKKEDVDPLLIEKLENPEWIYGAAPKYEIQLERKFSFGNATLDVHVERGKIKDIKIYSDSLSIIDFVPIQEKLLEVLFEENSVMALIESLTTNND
jgi:lipoate-protein ligase A